MKNLTKAEQTKTQILERVNAFYNLHGVDHTIVRLAAQIGMGKSRITNYFPKKEHLIISLLTEYEKRLSSLFEKHQGNGAIADFRGFVPFVSDAMELMFQYRGVISYSMVNPAMDTDIFVHIKAKYAQNKVRIRNRIENFVQSGLMRKDLLETDAFEEYVFQYICMSSNWIITHNLLSPDQDFETVKPRYMHSILCCMKPYLTEKGHASLEAVLKEQELAQPTE